MEKTLTITIGELKRIIPIRRVSAGLSIAFLPVFGDTELIMYSARTFAAWLPQGAECIVAPESGGIAIGHQLAVATGLPYVIARKKAPPGVTTWVEASVRSVLSAQPEKLMLMTEDLNRITGRNVVIVDDVVCTGSTVRALIHLVGQVGGQVLAKFAIATQGEERSDIRALVHLPTFEEHSIS